MTPYESFLFSKNGSSILMQLVLITFFYTEIYIYIYVYNISNLANPHRTVTNKKCEKVYTNRIITR